MKSIWSDICAFTWVSNPMHSLGSELCHIILLQSSPFKQAVTIVAYCCAEAIVHRPTYLLLLRFSKLFRRISSFLIRRSFSLPCSDSCISWNGTLPNLMFNCHCPAPSYSIKRVLWILLLWRAVQSLLRRLLSPSQPVFDVISAGGVPGLAPTFVTPTETSKKFLRPFLEDLRKQCCSSLLFMKQSNFIVFWCDQQPTSSHSSHQWAH